MSRTAALSYAIGLLLALPALVLLPVGRLDGAAGTVFAVFPRCCPGDRGVFLMAGEPDDGFGKEFVEIK